MPHLLEVGPQMDTQAVAATHHKDPAQFTRFHQRLDLDVLRIHAHLPCHREGHGSALHCLDDAVGFRQRERHRLLWDDGLACGGGLLD
ncbi:MAG: hypothetical protein JXR84_13240 [Anaerolineae bacterium]|nr:hypothetical protein [Anaerolineae bacterium]